MTVFKSLQSKELHALVHTELKGLEPIQDLVELTLFTPYVKDEHIVSLLIVGKPESGRTELIKKYRFNKGVIPREKFTARGILGELLKKEIVPVLPKQKILGHLLNYEFSAILSYKHESLLQTLSFLDAFTEEGLSPQSSYWIQGREMQELTGLKGGIITVVNTANFFNKIGKVKRIFYEGGWFSRNIVASFDEADRITKTVFEGFEKGDYRHGKFIDKISLRLPCKQVEIKISSEIIHKITNIAEDIATLYNEEMDDTRARIKGKRMWKSLVSLVKASALRAGRFEVSDYDLERIENLSYWMNLKLRSTKEEYSFLRY